ncbi:unnamed protein product [Staurois parvus]|uniref:Uncharacterized protein n=1 Tax=Staurois parvus TaxID=386267 RepID=A0ABN9CP42_9NEOB|nr:unnamed protein product [Staurois parvus]
MHTSTMLLTHHNFSSLFPFPMYLKWLSSLSRGGLTIWKLGHCPRARGQ